MINLDPTIIDQESVRKKRRKKMLLTSIGPVLVLAMVGLFCIRPSTFDVLYRINYEGSADVDVNLSQMQKFANIIEPYIAFYDSGTAYIRNNEGAKAEADLRESLRQNPPYEKLCQIRVNLSYSIEIQADEASILAKYDQALLLYNRAEGVLYEDNCINRVSPQNSLDKNAASAQNRITKKRSSTIEKMNGVESGENDDEDDVQNGTVTDERAAELREGMMSAEDALDALNNSWRRGYSLSPGGGSINQYNY